MLYMKRSPLPIAKLIAVHPLPLLIDKVKTCHTQLVSVLRVRHKGTFVCSLKVTVMILTALFFASFTFLCLVHGGYPVDTQSRDVCIVGGGSAGTYAAIRLLDQNKTVIVIERRDRLGGNTQTYIDPVTGAPIDIGVDIWHNNALVSDYFQRLNVPLVSVNDLGSPFVTIYPDFQTGQIVSGYAPVDPTSALQAYTEQLLKYPYLDNGFNLPDPVPSDLLIPFGEFVNKYNLSAAVSLIFQTVEAIGNLLQVPTLYVMKYMGLTVVEGFENGFVTTAAHDNSQLYQSAQAVLATANAVLLSSNVISTTRDDNGAKIAVSTPAGLKHFQCKRLVLAIPPTPRNLAPFAFNATEISLFQQFTATGYYTGLIRNSGIPDNTSIQNTAADNPYNLPTLPCLYGFGATGVPGLHQVLYASSLPSPIKAVEADIIKTLKRLQAAGTVSPSLPEFAIFVSHSPFQFTVSVDAIQNGFYSHLNALQGVRSLFLTGAAFEAQDSSLIWQFTESLLPQIVG